MTQAPAVWPHPAGLDAARVLDRIADITGMRLQVEGQTRAGAAEVRWPDGRRSVLTESDARTGPLLDRARAAGVPAARIELAARVDGRRVVVAQRLPGAPPRRVDAGLVRKLIEVNDLLAGLMVDEADPRPAELHLTEAGPGLCLHEPLERFSARTARLLGWIREVGAAGSRMVGDDLVHMDFRPANVLVDAGRLVGVLAWEGAMRGDRHLDLVSLRFALGGADAEVLDLLEERLAAVSRQRRRAYWAHVSLRRVDWAIRHDPATVEHWLRVAESGMR